MKCATQVIGEGYHPEAGKPHAEVYALRGAGQAAKGATAYVTLEPCNHHGKTPPCSRALVAAQVSRVCLRVLTFVISEDMFIMWTCDIRGVVVLRTC